MGPSDHTVALVDHTDHTLAPVDLLDIQHQADLTVHLQLEEHAMRLRHTGQQAHCHLVDQQDHTNRLLRAMVHQADLLAVVFAYLVYLVHLAYLVAHTDQLVPTVQCHQADLLHGSCRCGLGNKAAR